jgi:hypothetical protein
LTNNGSVKDGKRTDFLYPFVKGQDMPWKDVIVPDYIIPFINEKKKQGSKPTVRGVLYHLESMRILPKNDLTYSRLKRVLSDARRGYKRSDGTRGSPTIPMDAFADTIRQIIKDFDDEERSLNDYINDGVVHFRKLPSGFKTRVPRWLDQKNYVEIWVEKASMTEDVVKAVKGQHVVIAPNRGSVSITFIHQNIERLIDQFIEHKRDKIYILYPGDLDPMGWDMDRKAREDLERETNEALSHEELIDEKGESRFVFKRIAVTKQQIKKYKLTHLMHPDTDTLKKLWKNKNLAETFKRQFGSVFQVELEALQLIPFKQFQALITSEIDKLYDEDVREEVLARPEYSQEPDEIKRQIVEALEDLIEELG